MKLNKEWHQAHKMPKNPSWEQRVQWHVAHAQHCHCRMPTGKMLEEVQKRGVVLPVK